MTRGIILHTDTYSNLFTFYISIPDAATPYWYIHISDTKKLVPHTYIYSYATRVITLGRISERRSTNPRGRTDENGAFRNNSSSYFRRRVCALSAVEKIVFQIRRRERVILSPRVIDGASVAYRSGPSWVLPAARG